MTSDKVPTRSACSRPYTACADRRCCKGVKPCQPANLSVNSAAAANGIRGRGAEVAFRLVWKGVWEMTEKTVINIDDVPLMDRGNGKQFAVKWGRVGPLVGLNGLGCAVHVVPPGKKAFPFHRHHVMDELFFVVSGEG